MVPKDDAGRGRAANSKGRIISATASSANQVARKRTIAPSINFSFMASPGNLIRVLALAFHVYLPIEVYDVGCSCLNLREAGLRQTQKVKGPRPNVEALEAERVVMTNPPSLTPTIPFSALGSPECSEGLA